MNQVRVACGLLLVLGLVAWAGWDAWRILRRYPWSPDQVVNDVPSFEIRFAEVRDQLPARGNVGYRDTLPRSHAQRRHAIAQYILAPLFVEWGTDRTPAVEVYGREIDPRVRVFPAGGP